MQNYSPTFKTCATCEFWGGSRQPDNFRSGAVVTDHMVQGKCYGKWNGSEKSSNSGCEGWKKWGVLK